MILLSEIIDTLTTISKRICRSDSLILFPSSMKGLSSLSSASTQFFSSLLASSYSSWSLYSLRIFFANKSAHFYFSFKVFITPLIMRCTARLSKVMLWSI